MEYPIPPKTEITFRADNRSFTCRVCYCIYRDHGYCVGVEFSGPQAWSPGIFRPEHLMDLQQLAQEDEPVTSRAGGS